jgi:predicted nucleic acid-binding protein
VSLAYVDSSCFVAVALGEPEADAMSRRLRKFDRVVSSNLLEAEIRAALIREGVAADPTPLFASLSWLFPARPLTPEILRAGRHGHLQGADLWHLACALYLAPNPRDANFLTLDARQGRVAEKLGFQR